MRDARNGTRIIEATTTRNFAFLAVHDPALADVAALAERYFADDPVTSLMKVRQLGELLAQQVAAHAGVLGDADESQAELLGRLRRETAFPRDVIDLFHDLRRVGNEAVHRHRGDHRTALAALKVARQLALWFHRTFGDRAFRAGPFEPPRAPPDPTAALREELDRLRSELPAAEEARLAAEAAEAARRTAEESARVAAEERAIWEAMATDNEARLLAMRTELDALQATAAASPPDARQALADAAGEAAQAINLDEQATRAIIDARLQARGWEADTASLRYATGARPVAGGNRAIAEWPTATGPADYALFVGLLCVGVVEAKRSRKNVSAAIDQAGRYSQGFSPEPAIVLPAGGPWAAQSGGATEPPYRVPFLFATNGRAYLKQLETQSGIWHRDARNPTNRRRALADWPTPDGLKASLDIDRTAASAELASLPFDFAFGLRDYQMRGIQAVETALADDDQRALLLAMATGTGKTKLAVALLYRLLHTRRFRRVCFVVDRTALGDQAKDAFTTTRIVSARTFADIFGLKVLGDAAPDPDTKVHICTIQGLVKRVLFAATPEDVPPVDQYDLMLVDECHRGYTLDREMSDAELGFRSEADYVSKYRRVIEHFDAVRIGLTATPALHTTEIFGRPIFTYGLREAVIDGWLVDQEPPIRIETELSRDGIHFSKGADLPLLDPLTGTIDLTTAPDDLGFEVESFNRRVVTAEFTRVVCEQLAAHIDPGDPGKTLIFAASDAHADLVVGALGAAMEARHGPQDEALIRKITGSIDRPGTMIRRYRNDPTPKIAVTVDLLTTGIDVPKIVNLAFLRRVNSRILYDQMIGRATRLCPEIGGPGIDKDSFRVFDAVRQSEAICALTEMKPVVVNRSLPFAQLMEELARVAYQRPKAAPSAGTLAEAERVVAAMGLAPSLERRFARLDEVQASWMPKAAASARGGVFGHLLPKERVGGPALEMPDVTITWEKFARTVLPEARRMDAFVGTGKLPLIALVTAEHADAPPILRWDRPDLRNAVSWFCYPGGSRAEDWGLAPGTWHPVTAVVPLPTLWGRARRRTWATAPCWCWRAAWTGGRAATPCFRSSCGRSCARSVRRWKPTPSVPSWAGVRRRPHAGWTCGWAGSSAPSASASTRTAPPRPTP